MAASLEDIDVSEGMTGEGSSATVDQLQAVQPYLPICLLRRISEEKATPRQRKPSAEPFEGACAFFDISGFSRLAAGLQRAEHSRTSMASTITGTRSASLSSPAHINKAHSEVLPHTSASDLSSHIPDRTTSDIPIYRMDFAPPPAPPAGQAQAGARAVHDVLYSRTTTNTRQ